MPVLILSVVAAGLVGLSTGAKVDEWLRPVVGPTGAAVAGFGAALVVWVFFGSVSYRGLTR